MTILLDTGPLVAAMDRGDRHHRRCVRLLEELPAPLLLPCMAERLGIKQVATLDRRDFGVVRPRHIDAFQLLP